jgi:endonuclease YncB( thermonuclease family)
MAVRAGGGAPAQRSGARTGLELRAAKDRHQRVLAVCSLPDGTDLNAWMVRQGWAVASGFVKIYGDEEAEAEAQKRGMWTGKQHKPK